MPGIGPMTGPAGAAALRHHPGQREPAGGHAVLLGDRADPVDELGVPGDVPAREARAGPAVVVGGGTRLTRATGGVTG